MTKIMNLTNTYKYGYMLVVQSGSSPLKRARQRLMILIWNLVREFSSDDTASACIQKNFPTQSFWKICPFIQIMSGLIFSIRACIFTRWIVFGKKTVNLKHCLKRLQRNPLLIGIYRLPYSFEYNKLIFFSPLN